MMSKYAHVAQTINYESESLLTIGPAYQMLKTTCSDGWIASWVFLHNTQT